ncbi:M23 family metallopeptidase [Tabrizicola sp.]|uniref:M23 family metallopeptidase n=1 Tax=Tabrizicola sp. TaxID=2005166 RepID=UPI00286D170D|nr:M23 family metallopeptidase [Tabrizicola sp.]
MIGRTLLLTLALAVPAGAFDLQLPVDCTLGEDCYIQQYFDHDPTEGATDFLCGPMSYDGHDGTDFALPTRTNMREGVAVLAAAPGTVISSRDSVPDFFPHYADQACGNGVTIDHGQGWQTQYCHLRRASVLVNAGDKVDTGTPLGQVGESGNAGGFPHLHFSVRYKGQKIDPFAPSGHTCARVGSNLWAEDLPIKTLGLLSIGISTEIPRHNRIETGLSSPDLPSTAPALVVWAHYFGPRKGDQVVLALTGPEGVVIWQLYTVEKTQARAFRAVGRKLKPTGWPPGWYGGAAIVMRDGVKLDAMQMSLRVLP